jgi:hypothetical protein
MGEGEEGRVWGWTEEERRRWEGGRRKRLRLRWGWDGGWGGDAGERVPIHGD